MTSAQNTWIQFLAESVGLPAWMSDGWVAALGLSFIYAMIIFPSGIFMSFISRKMGADFQARVGPSRTGPAGMLQPVADLIKLLRKEAARGWNWREVLWLSVHAMALYSTVAVIPLGSMALIVNTDMSAFLPFFAVLVLSLGTMLLGFSQGSVPGWFGGVRVAAQALAGAFPALVSVLCAGVRTGDFHWSAFARSQGASPLSWAVMNPFQLVAFLVFMISGMVILGLPPMDAGLSAPDIHGGVSSELSGRRLSFFKFGRFYGFFLWSVIAAVVFLGAWNIPFGLSERLTEAGQSGWVLFIEATWLLAKVYLLMLVVVSVSRVTPRGRADQITDFSWRVLSPFSLFALIGDAVWVGLRGLL